MSSSQLHLSTNVPDRALPTSSHCDRSALSPGYAEQMGLAQFRRRFQVLDPALLKKLDLTSEGLDERKVHEVDHGQEEATEPVPCTLLKGQMDQEGSKRGL